ncbi:MAG: CvpA family protein [Gammaproteobacteria bacterium WSBS_2016_MAG_OTU1]
MDISSINTIDLVLGVIIILSSAFGSWRGAIRGVFGIISLVLAFVLAKQFGGVLGGTLSIILGKSAVTVLVGYMIAFLIAMMVLSSLTFLLQKIASKADLGMMDTVGGFVFGFLRGGVFSLLIVFLLSAMSLEKQAIWQNSVLVPFFGKTLNVAVNLLDEKYERYFKFDREGRPLLLLPDLESVAHEVQQRDNLLDNILDEEAKSGKQADSARQERKESVIQQVNNSANKKIKELVDAAERRKIEERRKKPLSETEVVPTTITGQLKHYTDKLIDIECTGDSCAER